MKKVIIIGLLGATLVACGKGNLVDISTAKGQITCDLYLDNITILDKAVKKPTGLSQREANSLCKIEGKRRQRQG